MRQARCGCLEIAIGDRHLARLILEDPLSLVSVHSLLGNWLSPPLDVSEVRPSLFGKSSENRN